jgi:hypothetical protein
MSDSQQSTTPTNVGHTPTANSRGGRGRGRGNGRGRGRGQQTQPGMPTTLGQRAAQVAASSAAPANPLPVAPIPLAQLSAIMDSHFPVAAEPVEYLSEVMIDANGYVDLCHTVYTTIINQKDEYGKILSEPEFLLCSGWLLAHRVLSVRNTIVPITTNGFVEFENAMAALPMIPEPIAHYLEGLGLYRDAHGNTLCPIIPLPKYNGAGEGIIPSTVESELSATADNLACAMFPFGFYERYIVTHRNNQPNPRLLTHVTLAAPAQGQADPAPYWTTRRYTLPIPQEILPAHTVRKDLMADTLSIENLRILRSVRWSTTLFRQFCAFCQRIQKSISCVKLTTSMSGSPAMTSVCCTDDEIARRAQSYRVYAFMALSNAEMHASRLFRYRMKVERTEDYYRDGADAAAMEAPYRSAPHSLQGEPPMEITMIRMMSIYQQHYVNHFVKT